MKIKEIAEIVGGVVALSKGLGLSRGAVSQWKEVPSNHVIPLCKLTDWAVTPHRVRPDLYPNADDGLPLMLRSERAA
jgi:hypothetical protein